MTSQSDRAIIVVAVGWLAEGLLASELGVALMTEFGLSRREASELARKAIERHKKQKDTKPLDQEPDDD